MKSAYLKFALAFVLVAFSMWVGSQMVADTLSELSLEITPEQVDALIGDEAADAAFEGSFAPHVAYLRPRSPSLSDQSSCADVLAPEAAFYVYEDVLEALTDGTPPADVQFIVCFIDLASVGADADVARTLLLTTSFERSVLLGYLAHRFEVSIERTVEIGYERGGYVAWPGSYIGETALIAFQQTGDQRFLILYKDYFDRLLELSDARLGIVDEYHGRIMNSWGYRMPAGVLGEEDQRDWVAHVTHFGRIMTPAVGFANEILKDPVLEEEHAKWAYDVVRFFESGWQQFEADRRPFGDGSRGWYWRPIDDEFEPINHVTSLGRALAAVYDITKDPVYGRRIEEIIWVFEDAIEIQPDGTASWPYSPRFQTVTSMQSGIDTEYAEYTWKAAITLPFVNDALAAGFAFSSGVVDAIRARLVTYVLADGVWKRNIHPRDVKPIRDQETSRLYAALGGLHLAFPEDAEIEALVKQMLVFNSDIYVDGWFTHPGTSRSFAIFVQ